MYIILYDENNNNKRRVFVKHYLCPPSYMPSIKAVFKVYGPLPYAFDI